MFYLNDPTGSLYCVYAALFVDNSVKSLTQDLLIQYRVLSRWILRYILYIKNTSRCFYESLFIDGTAKSHAVDLPIQHIVLYRWILCHMLYIKNPCGCFYESLFIKTPCFFSWGCYDSEIIIITNIFSEFVKKLP